MKDIVGLDIESVKFNKNEFEKMIQERANHYRKLLRLIDIEVKTARDLMECIKPYDYKIDKLISEEAEEMWKYFKNNYSQKIQFYSVEHVADKFYLLFKDITALGLTAAQLDNFLKIFLTNLGKIDVVNIYKLKIKNIKYLISNENFNEYIKKIFKYPGLKVITIDDINDIFSNYAQADKFFELNDLLASFSNFSAPELQLEKCDLKIKILKRVDWKKFNKVVIDYHVYWDPSEGALDKINETINKGIDEKLYDALVADWGLNSIGLTWFLNLLETNERDFYLDKNNARNFAVLRKKYNLLSITRSIYGNEVVKIEDSQELPTNHIKLLLDNKDFFSNDNIRTCIFTYFPTKVEKYQGAEGMDLDDIIFIFQHKYSFVYGHDFAGLAEQLTQKYSFLNTDIENLIEYIREEEKEIKTLYENINNSCVLNTYNILLKLYKDTDVNKFNILLQSIKTKNIENISEFISILQEMKISIKNPENLDYLIKIILSQPSVVKNLKNLEFINFYKKIIDYFYEGRSSIQSISEISEIYDNIIKKGKSRSILFTDAFINTYSYIYRKFSKGFYKVELDVSYLLPIMLLSEDFNEVKMESLIERLGEPVTLNELMLLNGVLKFPELEKVLFNKEIALNEMREIYKLPANPRQSLDAIGILEILKTEENKEVYDREIARIKQTYTERPLLDNLPKLQLLRLYLLKKALDDEKFLKSVGEIVVRDLGKKDTEIGGGFYFNKKSGIEIREIMSLSTDNEAYTNQKDAKFNGTIFTFHCHITQPDCSEYSGPSGYLGGMMGDISSAESSNTTGVVITGMGYPKDKNGNEIKNKLIVNFDLYFVDKTDSKVYIIDMGNRIVDLPTM